MLLFCPRARAKVLRLLSFAFEVWLCCQVKRSAAMYLAPLCVLLKSWCISHPLIPFCSLSSSAIFLCPVFSLSPFSPLESYFHQSTLLFPFSSCSMCLSLAFHFLSSVTQSASSRDGDRDSGIKRERDQKAPITRETHGCFWSFDLSQCPVTKAASGKRESRTWWVAECFPRATHLARRERTGCTGHMTLVLSASSSGNWGMGKVASVQATVADGETWEFEWIKNTFSPVRK